MFSASNYAADITFADNGPSTTMTLAFDGSNYYSSTGGGQGSPYVQYSASGAFIASNSPGIDFRSVFTDASGNLLARGFNDSTIYKQNSFGSFSALLSLNGGSLDGQSSVVLNSSGDFVAMSGGNVDVWDASGNILSQFSLTGYVDSGYPFDRGIAAAGNYLLTYANQTLQAWDYSGNLVDTTTLTGAGTSFDSGFSLSYTNDHVFIVSTAGGTWDGYDIGLGQQNGNVPEPASIALVGLALSALGFARRSKR